MKETTTMMKKTLLSTALFLFTALGAAAQAHVKFSTTEILLPHVKWQLAQTQELTVENVGNDTLDILAIEPDCGCTKAVCTQRHIAPRQKATISVTFDAAQLGHFQKGIAIYTNARPAPYFVYLKGQVEMERTGRAEDYPYSIGEVRLSTDNIEFDDVKRGDRPVKVVEIFNNGKTTITPSLLHLPSYIQATISPKRLHPQRKGTITLQLDSKAIKDMGLTQEAVYFSTYKGERIQQKNEMGLSVTLLPEVFATARSLSYAPVAVLDSTTIQLGKLNGKKAKCQLYLTNKGKSTLEIRSLQVYNPGISVSIANRKIAAGERAKIKITLNPAVRYFKGRHRILMITNDPRQPKLIIDVVAQK